MEVVQVQIIDAICGSGKTTWMFNKIRNNSDKRWIFVSPYLDEVGDGKTKGRIQAELPALKFRAPSSSPTKQASFLRLVENHCNISITHRLFMDFTPEITSKYKVRGVPTMIIVDDEGNTVSTLVGVKTKDEIEDWVSSNI